MTYLQHIHRDCGRAELLHQIFWHRLEPNQFRLLNYKPPAYPFKLVYRLIFMQHSVEPLPLLRWLVFGLLKFSQTNRIFKSAPSG
jgi:hypothetical protein